MVRKAERLHVDVAVIPKMEVIHSMYKGEGVSVNTSRKYSFILYQKIIQVIQIIQQWLTLGQYCCSYASKNITVRKQLFRQHVN